MTRFDVLVVGSGLAGEMAAVAAARAGRSVAILSKVPPPSTHSSIATAGVNLAQSSSDSWQKHAADVWNDGHFLSDWVAIERLAADAPDVVLTEFGDLLDRDARGQVVFYQAGGTRRAVRAGKNTGMRLVRRLYNRATELGVTVLTDRVVTSLVVEDGECVGLIALNTQRGELEAYAASSVILCSGGFGYVFQNTAHAAHLSGDGHALAHRAGAVLQDMEFVRFHETTIYGASCVITESPGSKGMHLYNRNGERFVTKYDARGESVHEYYLKRYMQLELDAGLGIEDKYFLADFTHLGDAFINAEFSRSRRVCLAAIGLDLARDRVPIVPGVFMTIGGIATDIDGKTTVGGLYAAGECACPGIHGADWQRGNTLLAALVFGRRAGIAAASAVTRMSAEGALKAAARIDAERLNAIVARSTGEPHHVICSDLRRMMSRNVGVVRDGARLKRALEEIERLRAKYLTAIVWDASFQFNEPLVAFLELENMLLVGEAVATAALAREESRGCHWRSDFPNRDDATWQRHSKLTPGPNGSMLSHVPVHAGELRPSPEVILL